MSIESLPTVDRIIWLCDDLIGRLENSVDLKKPGLKPIRLRQLANAVRELGFNRAPIRLTQVEELGWQVNWTEPDFADSGMMQFNVESLAFDGDDWGTNGGQWLRVRRGCDIAQANKQLIGVLKSWKSYVLAFAKIPALPTFITVRQIENSFRTNSGEKLGDQAIRDRLKLAKVESRDGDFRFCEVVQAMEKPAVRGRKLFFRPELFRAE